MFVPKKTKNVSCSPVEVVDMFYVENKDFKITLGIANLVTGRVVEETVSFANFNPSVLEYLLRKNGGYFRNAKNLCKYIEQTVENRLYMNAKALVEGKTAMISQAHSDLGWARCDNKLVFKGESIYSENGTIDSIYCGSRNIFPAGNMEAVMNMLHECVIGNTPMEAIMCMGATATILPFANRCWDVSITNPIFHLVGDSTIGKSTATDLFASLGGNPRGKGGNVLSYASSTEAITRTVSNVCGYPIGIDELSASKRKEFSEFIYNLANGVDQERCTGAGTTKIIEGCETAIISNGEADILSKCSRNIGLRVRVFEFQVEGTWTRNAEESEKVKSVVAKNYGWITPLVAKELLRKGEQYRKVFEGWVRYIKKEVRRKKIRFGCSDRVTNVVALNMTACNLINDLLNISMNTEEIFEFFFSHIIIKIAEEASLGLSAYEVLKRHYVLNRDLYPIACKSMVSNGYEMPPEDKGFVVTTRRKHEDKDGTAYYCYVVFRPDEVDEVLKYAGFKDTNVALSSIRKLGLLRSHDGARNDFKIRINGTKVKMKGIWIKTNLAGDDEDRDATDADEDD